MMDDEDPNEIKKSADKVAELFNSGRLTSQVQEGDVINPGYPGQHDEIQNLRREDFESRKPPASNELTEDILEIHNERVRRHDDEGIEDRLRIRIEGRPEYANLSIEDRLKAGVTMDNKEMQALEEAQKILSEAEDIPAKPNRLRQKIIRHFNPIIDENPESLPLEQREYYEQAKKAYDEASPEPVTFNESYKVYVEDVQSVNLDGLLGNEWEYYSKEKLELKEVLQENQQQLDELNQSRPPLSDHEESLFASVQDVDREYNKAIRQQQAYLNTVEYNDNTIFKADPDPLLPLDDSLPQRKINPISIEDEEDIRAALEEDNIQETQRQLNALRKVDVARAEAVQKSYKDIEHIDLSKAMVKEDAKAIMDQDQGQGTNVFDDRDGSSVGQRSDFDADAIERSYKVDKNARVPDERGGIPHEMQRLVENNPEIQQAIARSYGDVVRGSAEQRTAGEEVSPDGAGQKQSQNRGVTSRK